MRKIVALLVAAAMLCALASCSNLITGTKKGTAGLQYAQNNGSYIVTGYDGNDVNIVIPDTYKDIAVTGIADYAFQESDIQSIIFGENITSIGTSAFEDATLLKSATFSSPEKMEIGSSAFSGCISLSAITFASAELEICDSAFGYCTSLNDVKFTSVDYDITIGESAFKSCDALRELDLSQANHESYVSSSAFSNCHDLTVYIPLSLDLYFSFFSHDWQLYGDADITDSSGRFYAEIYHMD